MDMKDNHLRLRMAVGSGLLVVGSALMSRLPQLLPGQQVLQWYQQPFLLAGIAIAVMGLLILLVPPLSWRNIWNLMVRAPRWLHDIYVWKRYGVKYTIGDPKIDSEALKDTTDVRYVASIEILIKNKGMPLRVRLNSIRVLMEQETEWGDLLTVELLNRTWIPEKELKPWEEGCYQVVVSVICSGNPEGWPNLNDHYDWGIRGVCLTLPKAGMKEFHKGIKRKPAREERIGLI